MACVGAGTGLGEVFLTNGGGGCGRGGGDDSDNDDTEGYAAFPTEGGHAEFAPRTLLEFEMLQ